MREAAEVREVREWAEVGQAAVEDEHGVNAAMTWERFISSGSEERGISEAG